MTPALVVKNLRKQFGSFDAVKGISFIVPHGKVVGLLGPNGAGKTTTISMLLGILTPNSGSIRYFGQDFAHHRYECLARINATSAFSEQLSRITVRENLTVFAHLYGVANPQRRIDELGERFGLMPLMNRVYFDLSSGQKTRANVVKSLLNDPDLILMDEPTASLDPDVADNLLTVIETLRTERSVSVLYTSHNMSEVTRICDEVIFLDHGTIVAQDTPLGLTKRLTHATLTMTFDATQTKVRSFVATHKLDATFPRKNIVTIATEEVDIPKLIFGLGQADVWITNIDIQKPTLEDVFLDIARKPKVTA